MTPAPHTTPLNPKPPVGTKSRVGHSKLSAPEDGAQRPSLASPPPNWAERITLSATWTERSLTKKTGGNHLPLACLPSCWAGRITSSATRLRRASLHPNNSPILRTKTKTLQEEDAAPRQPLGGQLHLSAALPPPANIPMKTREVHTSCRTLTASAAPLPSGNARRAAPSCCAGRTITLPAAWAETSLTKTTYTNHLPLGGQLHLSAALPPPANIQMKTREAPTTVPDSPSLGSSLPSGTSAALRPATAARAAEILIENARLEFRVNHGKQRLAIKSNRERMALPSLHNSARGEADSRKRKASLTSKEVSYIDAGAYVVDKPNADPSTALGMTASRREAYGEGKNQCATGRSLNTSN